MIESMRVSVSVILTNPLVLCDVDEVEEQEAATRIPSAKRRSRAL